MRQEQMKQLQRLPDRLSEKVAANDYHQAARADLDFARYIWEQAGSGILAQTLVHLTAPLFPFACVLRSTGAEDSSQAVQSHLPIFQALRSRETERIRKAIRAHLADSYDRFLQSGAEDCRTHARTHLASRKAALA